jgi:hypothetical protein
MKLSVEKPKRRNVGLECQEIGCLISTVRNSAIDSGRLAQTPTEATEAPTLLPTPGDWCSLSRATMLTAADTSAQCFVSFHAAPGT